MLVRLEADAVDFAFDDALSVPDHGVDDLRGAPGQHGPQRTEHLEPDLVQGVGAAGQRGFGDRGGIPGEHHGTLHGGQRDAGSLGDGGEHDAVLSALTHPAEHQPAKVLLLGLGGSAEQVCQFGASHACGARAGGGGEDLEGRVDVTDRQCCLGRWLRKGAQAAPAHPEAALRHDIGEICRHERDILRARVGKQLRNQPDFGVARGRGHQGRGGLDESGELHTHDCGRAHRQWERTSVRRGSDSATRSSCCRRADHPASRPRQRSPSLPGCTRWCTSARGQSS